jgi:hypothetical protein
MTPFRAFATAAAVLAIVVPFLALPSAPAHSYSSGAPPGFSGPEQYCNVCHSDSGDPDSNPVNSGTGSVEITAATTFAPGDTILVRVTVHSTTEPQGPELKQGFELSARDAALAHVGRFLVGGARVQYAQGDQRYVTHTTVSNTDTTWFFGWVAPAVDPPQTVTFYAAGNAANGNGFPDLDDEIYADTHELALVIPATEPGAPALAFRLDAPFPNPLRTGAAATARYTLDRAAEVEVLLRDGRGRVVRVLERGHRGGGPHALRVEAAGLPAGTYFLTLSTREGTQAQPLTVVR